MKHIVIRMTLAYCCACNTHLNKLKTHILKTITATATLLCTVIQLEMVLRSR